MSITRTSSTPGGGIQPPTPRLVRIRRSSRASYVGAALMAVAVVALAYLPYGASRGTQVELVLLFTYVVVAAMWNLLAGYGGMVSVGQQAFIGVGAYGLVYLADQVGLNPFVAIPIAALASAIVAWISSYLVFRLIGGYFAIGTWVLAEVVRLLVVQVDRLGAGSGISLRALSRYEPVYRIAYVYWTALACMVVAVLAVYLVLRSRLGLALTAIRDDVVAADTLGVRVTWAKRIVWMTAAAGCGLAGAVLAASALRVQPDSIFSVNYSAFMIFMVIIGGIGTIEGPIIGAIVFYLLQDLLRDLGSVYLIVLGLVAIVFTLYLPKGLWGLLSRGRLRLFPVGYRIDDRSP